MDKVYYTTVGMAFATLLLPWNMRRELMYQHEKETVNHEVKNNTHYLQNVCTPSLEYLTCNETSIEEKPL